MKNFAIQLEHDTLRPKVLRPVISIKRDSKGKIISGLQIGSTQGQNEALILISNPGEFKNSPRLGVGLENATLGDHAELLRYRHAVRRNYALEGLEIDKLELYDWKRFEIKAHYI